MKAWEDIAEGMKGIGPVERSMHELKRKKETWFSEVKKKVNKKHTTNIILVKGDCSCYINKF
jgi:hypothetical protein